MRPETFDFLCLLLLAAVVSTGARTHKTHLIKVHDQNPTGSAEDESWMEYKRPETITSSAPIQSKRPVVDAQHEPEAAGDISPRRVRMAPGVDLKDAWMEADTSSTLQADTSVQDDTPVQDDTGDTNGSPTEAARDAQVSKLSKKVQEVQNSQTTRRIHSSNEPEDDVRPIQAQTDPQTSPPTPPHAVVFEHKKKDGVDHLNWVHHELHGHEVEVRKGASHKGAIMIPLGSTLKTNKGGLLLYTPEDEDEEQTEQGKEPLKAALKKKSEDKKGQKTVVERPPRPSQDDNHEEDSLDHRTFSWRASLGLTICLGGSLVSSGGLVLMKYSAMVEEEEPIYRRWRWWLGFVCLVILGGGIDGLALYLCPLSLIAPMSGVTIVTNSIFMTCFLGEKMSWMQVIATAVVVVGCSLTSAFGTHQQGNYDAKGIIELLQEWYIIPYYFFTIVIFAISLAVICYPGRSNFAQALAYANIAGLLGGNQNTYLKCIMELISESIYGEMQLTHLLVYGLLVAFTITAVAQLSILNEGLAKHAAVEYLPMYQSALTIYGVIAGGVFFQEFRHFNTVSWVMFPGGVLVVLIGLLMFGPCFKSDDALKDGDALDKEFDEAI